MTVEKDLVHETKIYLVADNAGPEIIATGQLE